MNELNQSMIHKIEISSVLTKHSLMLPAALSAIVSCPKRVQILLCRKFTTISITIRETAHSSMVKSIMHYQNNSDTPTVTKSPERRATSFTAENNRSNRGYHCHQVSNHGDNGHPIRERRW